VLFDGADIGGCQGQICLDCRDFAADMTACLDLALAMVEADYGVELSRQIARKMVVYHCRSGGQSQFSALLELEPKSDRIQSALTYAKRNLPKPLSVDELADVANLSSRQFSRAFRVETGQSPARAIEILWVEAARCSSCVRAAAAGDQAGNAAGSIAACISTSLVVAAGRQVESSSHVCKCESCFQSTTRAVV
jgi:AraC-like DNA-binding protein